jgi:hypothetical protein
MFDPREGGRITDLERFTEGDCNVLATAISKRTGWPVCSFMGKSWDGSEDMIPDLHAFVIRPDGKVLDVQGVCTLSQFRARWSQRAPIKVWPSPLAFRKAWGESPFFGHYSYERARKVADQLVDLYGSC